MSKPRRRWRRSQKRYDWTVGQGSRIARWAACLVLGEDIASLHGEAGRLVPTGDAYAEDDEASVPHAWAIAFRCPDHPDEIIRMWRTEFQPLIDEVLAGVDVSSLPLVGPGLREL